MANRGGATPLFAGPNPPLAFSLVTDFGLRNVISAPA